jgi:hypothetical protein
MAVAAALFCGSPAFAATGGRLLYRAPAGCASQADFEASVATRGAHFDDAAASQGGRELRVSITEAPGGFQGSFQSVAAEGSSTIREVHAATCQEVVGALAVVSAIALRGDEAPESNGSSNADTATPTAPTEPASPLPAAKPARSPTPRPQADEGRLRARSGVGASRRVEVSAGTLRIDQARLVSLFAGGELGLLPGKVLPRYDLSITGATFVTTPDGRSYIAGVIPRLRLTYLGEGSYRTPSAAVSAQGVGFAMGLCWSPTYDTRGLVALLCAEYGLGQLQFKSTALQQNQTHTTTSALQSAGLSFESEYHFGSLLHLALKLGADASLEPATATLPSGSPIFQSSKFLGYGMLGLGFQF